MASFLFHHQRIAYTEFGGGPAELKSDGTRGKTPPRAKAAKRPIILVHGLLLSQKMHKPLAKELAARGNRVITVDLLGHGESDRPRDMWRYSMHSFAEQLVALMDHLEIEEAVVMGTSLGANAALQVAATAPERLRGMVIEMPVLDNGLLSSALTFTPILVALTFGEPLMKLVSSGTRALPGGCCLTTATWYSTWCARIQAQAARYCKVSSSGGSRRIGTNGAPSRRPRSCSDTGATLFIPSQMLACWPKSCPMLA